MSSIQPRWYDYIRYNLYWFALTTRGQTISPIIVPLLVQQFVGETAKGTYLGTIRLWALMVALLIQALMGMLSDRSTHPWGRRRPFILLGTIGEILAFTLIGLAAGLQGLEGFWVLFGLYIFSMFSSNVAHAATQGLIPDLVPEPLRGRFSGVKAFLELPLPLIFVSFVVARWIGAGHLWAGIGAVIGVFLVCAAVTMTIPEQRLAVPSFALDWQPILRLAMMTGMFTVIILAGGAVIRWGVHFTALLGADTRRWLVGALGLVIMAVVVVVGVLGSLRIGLGRDWNLAPSFPWWVVNRLAYLVGSTNLATFLLYFLQERFAEFQGERAAAPAASIVMVVGIFILLTTLPSGWLSDRLGKRPILVLAGSLAALGTLLVVWAPNLTLLRVSGAILGAATGLFYAANWALGTEIVPSDQAGRFLGLSNLAGAGAGAIGAYIGGPVADAVGYTALMLTFGILFLFSILALARIRPSQSAA
ncbi:MFS transporter [uncultured Thermanaerothrix sp.]|uniref:MFS transporter n=1 Tax=uncultured Thermanaerothrix sp. TaxID=1195149 RepID=UPI00263352A2|nr:MFS transporter [uncultured Thermanaerothrix sp.]